MKLLILLMLTWKFSFSLKSFEFCDFDRDELFLDCTKGIYVYGHRIIGERIRCGYKDIPRKYIQSIQNVGCDFTEFKLFRNCTTLKLFDVGKMKSIQKDTFSEMNMPNLLDLRFIGSNSVIMKSALHGTHQLKVLHIIDDVSSITALPSGFFKDSTQLEYLFLKGSKISNLSAIDFTGLEKLRMLDLTTDQISYKTGNWNILKSLRYLLLENNRISDIQWMASLRIRNLFLLSLYQNSIERLGANVFSKFVNLRTLILNSNAISCIENGAFSNLNALKKLDLTNNRHTALDEYTFKGLSGLQYLSLKGNRISAMSVNTFSALTNLIQMDLSNQDGVVTIDLNAFPQFIDLQTKNVLAEKSAEPDNIEQKEFKWLKRIDSYTRNTLFSDDAFTLFFKTPSEDTQTQADLHNLTQHIIDKSLILGNLDLSNNTIISINVEKNH
ncbi:insulin-like growth factor-binding protein complex acid labile subunit [Bradysia coprophila]|uniref:insulin-like growth factor-binding protein complex acid labile subunit n=1 Tax=Bradysia coprophila TaxID=38358 RepID=UPI00187D9A75|nr:insulin-like growth factor-binding protein complex acid labile subunit [Bradysia coprophila]